MTDDSCLAGKWALIRRNELVDIPDRLTIHPDFLRTLSHAQFEYAFREIGKMFRQLYSEMAESPEKFGLPLYKADEYDYFSSQAREARSAPWNLFCFMLCLFSCGKFEGSESIPKGAQHAAGGVIADTTEVRRIGKAKKTGLLLKALCEHGFVFSGIKKYSLSSGSHIEIEYPDNPDVIEVLSLLAGKVYKTQLRDVKNPYSCMMMFSNAFIGWNYRVLAEDMNTCSLAQGCDYVADKMHNEADREVIFLIDEILVRQGYKMKRGDPNEGPSVRYFRGSSRTYEYALTSDRGDLYLELRIRNAENCLEYLSECPDDILSMFRHSDGGCRNRSGGVCVSGVSYRLDDEEKWHCGCCGAPFKLHPRKEDIPHYLKLIELGAAR